MFGNWKWMFFVYIHDNEDILSKMFRLFSACFAGNLISVPWLVHKSSDVTFALVFAYTAACLLSTGCYYKEWRLIFVDIFRNDHTQDVV